MHLKLAELLRSHRELVMHRPEDPVFPIHPGRATWVEDRARAQLPAYDAEGRALSVHATRATFCTWVGKLTLPEGLKDRLSRHHGSIAEWVYGDRDKEEMAKAVAQLPNIWPDMGGGGRRFPQKKDFLAQGLATANPMGTFNVGTKNVHPPSKTSRTPDPSLCQHSGSGSGVCGMAGGPEAFESDDGKPSPLAGLRTQTLISGSELGAADLAATLKTLNWLVSTLASRASHQERGDDPVHPTESE